MPSLTKTELRALYKKKRATLSTDEVAFLSKSITKQLINYFDFTTVKTLHCFLPITSKKEIDTTEIINYCFENNIRVFVPKVIGDNLISIEINKDTKFETSKWGIKEPVNGSNKVVVSMFDMCITPLLYADANGNRVGYGKGFYDRFFSENTVERKIGINYFGIREEVRDCCKTDISLDFLITPQGVFKF